LLIIRRGRACTVSQLATISRVKAKPATFRHLWGKIRDLVSNVEPIRLVAEYWPCLPHSVTSKVRIIEYKSDTNLKAFLRAGCVYQVFGSDKCQCTSNLMPCCPPPPSDLAGVCEIDSALWHALKTANKPCNARRSVRLSIHSGNVAMVGKNWMPSEAPHAPVIRRRGIP
jgi:hypothetical protein